MFIVAMIAAALFAGCTFPVRTGYDRSIGDYKPAPTAKAETANETAAPPQAAPAPAASPAAQAHQTTASAQKNAAAHKIIFYGYAVLALLALAAIVWAALKARAGGVLKLGSREIAVLPKQGSPNLIVASCALALACAVAGARRSCRARSMSALSASASTARALSFPGCGRW